jgi:hypothetical protein
MRNPITKSEYVEVVISDITLREFPFPKTLTTLENGKIVAIEAHRSGVLPEAPSGAAMVNDAAFKKAFLILRVGDARDDINKMPLTSLDVTANDGKLKEFGKLEVDFSQSRVVVSSAGAPLVANEVFGFNIIYEKAKKC